MGKIIDGKAIATALQDRLKEQIAYFSMTVGRKPKLAVIMVGEDPASAIYVRNKIRACEAVGVTSEAYRLADTTEPAYLEELISKLNNDRAVDGILVQLPLPPRFNAKKIITMIDPKKDVDGFHPENVGALTCGFDGIVPCTPKGCLKLIKSVQSDLTGLNAVVVGRSNIVGKPTGLLLLRENCTVTIAHSKTKNLPELVRTADILVAAVGRPRFVQGDWIKQNAIVIDVGINRLPDGKLCGDVDFDAAFNRCKAITPVPKGVGPMTIAMLLENTLDAFCHRRGLA